MFHASIESGCYPSPDLMLYLSACFKNYMNAKGGLSLEEAFIGPPVQRIGNYSSRRERFLKRFLFKCAIEYKDNKGRSQYDIADEFVERYFLDVDPASLVRAYRKEKL